MTGNGAAFMASGARWQVDPRLVVAIAGAESSFGLITCAPFNGWGWGCPNSPYDFESWADGFDTVMQGLRTNYLAEGRTSVALIHQKYAPVGADNDPTGLNNNWTINVSNFLIEQGGNPNNVDLSGVAGSLPLGQLLTDAARGSYDFAEEAPAAGDGEPVDPATAATDAAQPDLVVATGDPRQLEIVVRNTGQLAWRPEEVRLRRVDTEPRVGGDPFGAITGDAAIEPDALATFRVELSAIGAQAGTADTVWRLEGPAGPFGEAVERTVRFEVPPFVVGANRRVETTDARTVEVVTDGGTEQVHTATFVVKFQNAGSATWHRDGDGAVALGLRAAAGRPLTAIGWLAPEAPARMLEREAAPGEWASFAFRTSGSGGALALVPFTSEGWAAGPPAIVDAGATPEQLAQLAAANEPVARAQGTAASPRGAGDPADRGIGSAPT